MKDFNELEQMFWEWLITVAKQKQINEDQFLDYKKVINRYVPVLYKAASQCKKAPTQWTTNALNIDKNWFNRHPWE